jgi:hypothetical protein
MLPRLPKEPRLQLKIYFFSQYSARRNFLKSDTVEYRHIIDEFQQYLLWLIHKYILHFTTMAVEIFNLPPATLRQRIVTIFHGKKPTKISACQGKGNRNRFTIQGDLAKQIDLPKEKIVSELVFIPVVVLLKVVNLHQYGYLSAALPWMKDGARNPVIFFAHFISYRNAN